MNDIEKGQLAASTIQCFSGLSGRLIDFPGLLKRLIEERAWERRIDHRQLIELKSLRELITLKPIRGWGQDPRKIEAIIKDDAEALAMYREQMVGGKHVHHSDGDNGTIKPARGNTRAYSIDRVKREAPQFADAVLTGKMSPNAALVKAGIRAKTWTAPCDIELLARALERRYPNRFILK